jgi:predicted Zn-dependent protease
MSGSAGRVAWMRRGAVLVLLGAVSIAAAVASGRLESDPNRVFLKADAAFKAGRHAEAEAELRRLERLRPPTPVDRLLRGEVAQARDEPDRALAELAAVPDDHTVAPLARLRAGQIEVRRGRARPAEAAFRASLKLFPDGVQPRKELAYIHNVQHRQAELDATLGELLKLDALDFTYILHWTKTRNTVWNPNGDLPALRKFVTADPEDRWSRLALAEALRRLDRPGEAEGALAPLPDSDPEARAARVLLAMDRGDLAAAESLLAGGPEDHPGLARLRGQLALRRRDGAAAARQFRVAVDADPTDRLALHGLGTSLVMLGQSDAARPYLEAARRHDNLWALVARAATAEGEHDPRIPRELGLACAAIGRDLEALAWLRLAVRRDPADDESQKALRQLERASSCRSDAKGAGGSGPKGRPQGPEIIEPNSL